MSNQVSPEEVINRAQEARRRGEKTKISLSFADLSGLHLAGMDLVGADFEGADLTGAILAGAHLCRANLKNATLIGASLDGADLTDADLRGADLAGARIDDAVLASARLEGACLQAVFGDPLSMTAARMDQVTVELSEFTMRDIAQMVVRGVDVRENEVVPVSMREPPPSEDTAASEPPFPSQPVVSSGVPSLLPLLRGDDAAKAPPSRDPVSSSLSGSSREIVISDRYGGDDEPVSSKEVLPPLEFDRRLASAPDVRRALGSIPPSAPQPTPISSRSPSLPPPSRGVSIIPSFRSAEIATRLEQATSDQEQVPVSQRMFLQLNALIDDARFEAAPPVSLRPQKQDVQRLAASGFEFPMPGDEFLGVTIMDEMPRGTTSRCFAGEAKDGVSVVVRIFDPHCEGAPLQLPAFQRGLRALNRLQGASDPDIAVVELISVAADQTAYVARYYPGKSLVELLEVSMTLQAGLEAISSLAKTMEAIHRQGLMVRSWKPSNVLVDGFSLLMSEPDMVHLATLAQYRGDAGGYKAYAAPEELLGRGTRSPTADVFSLGKMLEFLLTGQEPLVPLGSPPLIAQRENIPQVLVEIVRRATAQEPAERYQTVADLLVDLQKFQDEGDRAVLLASIRPQVISQLSVPPMSTGREVVDIDELIREKIKGRKAEKVKKPAKLAWHRQAELGAALLGGLGGIAVTALMVLSPRSVDAMEGMSLYLAAAMGLAALALPVPSIKRIPYRFGTWFGLTLLVWLLDPIQLSELTWERQLESGSALQKQQAVQSLSRVGKKDATGAQLDNARFDKFDLDSLNFSGASLRNANFKRAFLVEARFDGAKVQGADFQGANLFGSTLMNAEGYDEALCDRYTILPTGLVCEDGFISAGTAEEEADPTTTAREADEAEIQRRVEERLRGRRL